MKTEKPTPCGAGSSVLSIEARHEKSNRRNTQDQYKFNVSSDKALKNSLGWALFFSPAGAPLALSDIRQWFEIKLAACLVLDGTNGCPIQPDRIKNPVIRPLVAAGMALREWSKDDLLRVTGTNAGVAASILLATLDRPEWSAWDYEAFTLVERLDVLAAAARKGGNIL